MLDLKSCRKILVTGAGGFIGSHLVENLVNRGCSVKAMTHYNSHQFWGHLEELPPETLKKVEIFSGDIQDPFCAQEALDGCDVVFHLAALIGIPYSYRAPMSYVETNVRGTVNLLQAARVQKVKRFIHTSTSETYGTALYTPIDEKHPLQGQSPYSASKIAADKMAESYGLAFDLPLVTVRPFNTFGPRQSARAIIPTIISQIAAGFKELKLGSLDPVRDLNFVKDTAEGFVLAAQSDQLLNEVVNIGSGKAVSIGDLAQKIISLMKAQVVIQKDPHRVRPENSEVMVLLSDSEKALKLAGWKPKYTLDEGLIETIEYISKNIQKYKPQTYTL